MADSSSAVLSGMIASGNSCYRQQYAPGDRWQSFLGVLFKGSCWSTAHSSKRVAVFTDYPRFVAIINRHAAQYQWASGG